LKYLDTLIKQSASPNRLKSAGASLKFHFYQHKIDEFVSDIDKLGSALTLSTVLAFRASTTASHGEVLSHLISLEKNQKAYSEDLQVSIALLQSQNGPNVHQIDDKVNACLTELEELRKKLPLAQEKAIISWLNFRQISWRYEEVPCAYQETFRWIFEEPTQNQRWDDFTSFLSMETTRPYLISGKAGSGKSTLMKYIVEHTTTRQYLADWAATGGYKLAIANFFFWNLGTQLQKSTVGLLRALLKSVLQSHPELVPVVFPDIYYDQRVSAGEPTFVEVKRAWNLLASNASNFLKIAIFIDGLDEFEGDHKDLSEFLKTLASPMVKIVISSRPINACLTVFRDSPSLRLQELTAKDMVVYVQGNLASHDIMVKLTKRHPKDTKEIVAEITEKAAGVFIWVKLVVKLLVDGLEDGDDMEELRMKLKSLPSDLRDIYRRMFSKIKKDYQVQAAEIFLLLQAWQSITPTETFSPVTLYCALRPLQECLDLHVESFDPETIAWCSQQVAARVRSRCCGLVFVYISEDEDIEVEAHSSVTYMHRTVAEFLVSDDVTAELQSLATFESNVKLASACVYVLKICGSLGPTGPLFYHFDHFIKIYRAASSQSSTRLNSLVITLDETMSQFQHQYGIWRPDRHWSAQLQDDHEVSIGMFSGPVEPMVFDANLDRADLFTFSARVCFLPFLQSFCPSNSHQLAACISYALESWARDLWTAATADDRATATKHITLPERRDTLLFLFQRLSVAAGEDCDEVLMGIIENLLHEFTAFQLDEELSVLLAGLLVTLRSPGDLVESAWFQTFKVKDISRVLCNSDDTQNHVLGNQLRSIQIGDNRKRTPHSPMVESNGALDDPVQGNVEIHHIDTPTTIPKSSSVVTQTSPQTEQPISKPRPRKAPPSKLRTKFVASISSNKIQLPQKKPPTNQIQVQSILSRTSEMISIIPVASRLAKIRHEDGEILTATHVMRGR
jgi:hypothetical protein